MKWSYSGWWTIALCFIIILDSIVTVIIGQEANPSILWVMDILDISLTVAMGLRLIWYIPFVYILYKYKTSWVAVILYILVYTVGVGVSL